MLTNPKQEINEVLKQEERKREREEDEMDNYNKLCDYLKAKNIILNYSYCSKSVLGKNRLISVSSLDLYENHPIATLCRNNHLNYFTCLTYVASKPGQVKNNHICNIFPVKLGSDVDKLLLREKYNGETSSLRDYFIHDGVLMVIPYMLTNRLEMFHVISKEKEIDAVRLYCYDINGRGHKLSLNRANKTVEYKNPQARILSFDKFDCSNFPFDCDHVYLDNKHASYIFSILYFCKFNQDGLWNKKIIGETGLLYRHVLLAERQEDSALACITKGALNRLLTISVEYHTSKKNCSYSNSSCYYRKIQPHQINRSEMFNIVVRPIPKNVRKIPVGTEGYLCCIEKSVSIESFNKSFALLPNVTIADEINIGKDLNYVFKRLLKKRKIFDFTSTNDHRSAENYYICINGGIPTKYAININSQSDLLRFVFRVKHYNPLIEVFVFNNVIILNRYVGIPFIPYKNILISPIELNTFFPDFKKSPQFQRFGLNCLDHAKLYAQYSTPTKWQVATNYSKNRLGSCDESKMFHFTSENINGYLKPDDSLKYCKITSQLKLNTVFSSHPQLTADSYILSNDKKIPNIIKQRYKLEYEFIKSYPRTIKNPPLEGMNILLNGNPRLIFSKDSSGQKYEAICYLMEVQTIGFELVFKPYSDLRFLISARKSTNSFSYHVYKILDDLHYLKYDTELYDNCFLGPDFKNQTKVVYELFTEVENSFYDGLKVSNCSSQKGLFVQQNTDHYKKLGVREPTVIASIYSIFGRSPIISLKYMTKYMNSNNTKTGQFDILEGEDIFEILRNHTCSYKNDSLIKVDMLSSKILLTNGQSCTLYNLYQQSLQNSAAQQFLPKYNSELINFFNVLKVGFNFLDANGRKHNCLMINDK